MPNKIEPKTKRHRRRPIQNRVQRRQKCKPPHKTRRGMVHIQQPQQKRNRQPANHHNRAHRRPRPNFHSFHAQD